MYAAASKEGLGESFGFEQLELNKSTPAVTDPSTSPNFDYGSWTINDRQAVNVVLLKDGVRSLPILAKFASSMTYLVLSAEFRDDSAPDIVCISSLSTHLIIYSIFED